MIFDPFGDFKSAGYLRNTLKLKKTEEIKRLEHLTFELGIDEALNFLSTIKSINYLSILKVHNILFSGFYPWAGKDRNELTPNLTIIKNHANHSHQTVFEHPKYIRLAIEYALKLASNPLYFRENPGEIMGLLAFSHPFLDGNGRTILLIFMELSYRAGFAINWSKTNKRDYLRALSLEINDPKKGYLTHYLKPYIINITNRNEWTETIFEIKGLDGLDKENISYKKLNDPDVIKTYQSEKYLSSRYKIVDE